MPIVTFNDNGRAAAASSKPVCLSTEDKTQLDALVTAAQDTVTPSPVKLAGQDEHEFVAAATVDQALGASGASGDYLSHLIIVPTTTTSVGTVQLKDGTGGTYRILFYGGTLPSTLPFAIPFGARAAASGGWIMTTGSNT
jgi:hypothetical protein